MQNSVVETFCNYCKMRLCRITLPMNVGLIKVYIWSYSPILLGWLLVKIFQQRYWFIRMRTDVRFWFSMPRSPKLCLTASSSPTDLDWTTLMFKSFAKLKDAGSFDSSMHFTLFPNHDWEQHHRQATIWMDVLISNPIRFVKTFVFFVLYGHNIFIHSHPGCLSSPKNAFEPSNLKVGWNSSLLGC